MSVQPLGEPTISEEVISSTLEESTTDSSSESMGTESGTNRSDTASARKQPTTNPIYCEAVGGPLTPEKRCSWQRCSETTAGGSTTFVDYIVSYTSQLVAKTLDVANVAVGDNNYAFTTAFNTIDIPGILGLASAAPIYTCFLSSLWAKALSNPQQYAKRAVPTQDEKIKLIVLFEKHENSSMDFEYVELLVNETNDLSVEVQNVPAATANVSLGAYTSLFANVDVTRFLLIATEVSIYTDSPSSAFVISLKLNRQNMNCSASIIMTTNTYSTVSTILINVVSGTGTVPTTLFSTVVVVSVGPATISRETYTIHATETWRAVRDITLLNGRVTRITKRVTVGTPGELVTVEVMMGANGGLVTRTATRRKVSHLPEQTLLFIHKSRMKSHLCTHC